MSKMWRNDKNNKEQAEQEDYEVTIVPNNIWMLGGGDGDLPFEEGEVVHKVGNRTYFILVIYDIVDNKRRTQLAKTLEGFGDRVQYSAFECHLTLRKYEELVKRMVRIIDEKEDLLRIYRLTGNNEMLVWGRVQRTYQEDVIII